MTVPLAAARYFKSICDLKRESQISCRPHDVHTRDRDVPTDNSIFGSSICAKKWRTDLNDFFVCMSDEEEVTREMLPDAVSSLSFPLCTVNPLLVPLLLLWRTFTFWNERVCTKKRACT